MNEIIQDMVPHGIISQHDADKITEPIPLEREQPKLTPFEQRKLRKMYVTVQHPKVKGCGHRLDLNRQPKHINCPTCLFAWFQNHGEVCQQLDEMHTAGGDALIIQLQGKKFLHKWKMFMSTIAQWKKENENAENNTN